MLTVTDLSHAKIVLFWGFNSNFPTSISSLSYKSTPPQGAGDSWEMGFFFWGGEGREGGREARVSTHVHFTFLFSRIKITRDGRKKQFTHLKQTNQRTEISIRV